MIDIQSDRILKKKSFKSAIVLSESSKHRLFLSCQMHLIKQWGTAIQIFFLICSQKKYFLVTNKLA